MKILELLLWVTQFGFSILFPPCALLLLAHWLQSSRGWGMWTTAVAGILGLLISVSTARANWRAMKKAAGQDDDSGTPVSFNDHS